MNINAIETTYAGYRFRSRLEARWAVFFDTLGLTWEYEPEGFLVGAGKRPYLPDFRIDRGEAEALWVEVKGHDAALDVDLLASFVDPDSGVSDKILVLGPVPDSHPTPTHSLIRCVFGVACHTWVLFTGHTDGKNLVQIGIETPLTDWTPTVDVEFWHRDLPIAAAVESAYQAARSARFEHGESGAPRSTSEAKREASAAAGAPIAASMTHDIEAEQAVLGAMLMSSEAAEICATKLVAGDFWRPAHVLIFDALLALRHTGRPADAVEVANHLAACDNLTRCGGAPYLQTLLGAIPVAAQVDRYADIVSTTAAERRREEEHQDHRRITWLRTHWPSVVGEDVAAHTEPTGLGDGELIITSDSAAWQTQVRLLGPTLVKQMSAYLGPGHGIRKIKSVRRR